MSAVVRERIPDEPGEFRCPECGRKCTLGPTGIEYGHARARRGRKNKERCSRRPECVDPDKPGAWRDE